MKCKLVEGYETERKEQRTVNGNAFEIITYKGDHRDEYLVREVKSGRCSLFYKGILKRSWKETNDGQSGGWTVYEKERAVNIDNRLEWDEMKEITYQFYCESMKNDMNHTYVELCKSDGLRWIHEGIVEKSSSVLIHLSLNLVVEVNTESHELLSVNGEDMSGIEHNAVLDLSDDGERWEGDVLDDEPYGWGVLYDKEGEMAYEGFRIGNVNICYGTQYYADIGVIEYEGEICEGKRWGRGIQYDRNGVVVYDGEWMNDGQLVKRIVMTRGTQFLHNHIEELIVSDKSCNGREWSVLDVSCMSHLRLLEVGDECFGNVNEMKLIGLHALERVVIGKQCFRKSDGKDPNRHFYLKDCERVKELKVGCWSFSDFAVCEIANVPSLEVIEMGELNEWSNNFCYASLELKSDGDEMK